MKDITRNKIRVAKLRRARDLCMKRARWAKEELAALKARDERDLYDRPMRIVVNVAKARAKNRSILMWRRLYQIA